MVKITRQVGVEEFRVFFREVTKGVPHKDMDLTHSKGWDHCKVELPK